MFVSGKKKKSSKEQMRPNISEFLSVSTCSSAGFRNMVISKLTQAAGEKLTLTKYVQNRVRTL